MKRAALILLVLFISLNLSVLVIAQGVGSDYIPGQFLVKFKESANMADVGKLNRNFGAAVERISPFSGTMRLKVPPGKTVEQMVKMYEKNPLVEYAQANYICRATFVPDDTNYPSQWHFFKINMGAAWDIQPGGSPSVKVAILDSGVAYENYGSYVQGPDLAGTNFVPGYDFINNDAHPNDGNRHGTHVAGTIAQTTNNTYRTAGMAFNTSIMPIQVLDSSGSGNSEALADGLHFAADNGADVANMSLSFQSWVWPGLIPNVTEAVQYAYSHGCTLVAAAGNDGKGTVSLPAAYPECIAVGATDSSDNLASFSQYGSDLELVAPGVNVLQETFQSGNPANFGLYYFSGTSMASPHVVGLVALMLAEDSSLTPAEIRQVLHDTAVDLGAAGWDTHFGYGRINAEAALAAISGSPSVTADFVGNPTSGDASLVVNFTDLSTGGPNSWSWTFGDGGFSNEQNPSHSYNTSGIYTVSLTASGPNGSDNETKVDYITVTAPPVPPTADFSGSPTSGGAPLDVNFTDLSTGDITSWAWTFGDGGTSNAQDPSHTYNVSGTYTVSLTVSGLNSSDNETKVDYITVTGTPPAPTAAFSGSPTSGVAPLNVSFTDLSTGDITDWSWDFGDGGNSTAQNPSHAYNIPGTYTVSLTVSGPGGTDIEIKTGYITVNEQLLPTMHVKSIEIILSQKGKNWGAVAEVTIVDENDAPLSGATVIGDWTGTIINLGVSATTKRDGVAKINSGSFKDSGELFFAVTDVTKIGYIYNPSDNVESSDFISVP